MNNAANLAGYSDSSILRDGSRLSKRIAALSEHGFPTVWEVDVISDFHGTTWHAQAISSRDCRALDGGSSASPAEALGKLRAALAYWKIEIDA